MLVLTKSAFSEKYYAGIKDDTRLHVKLTGSWETLVGGQDVFGDHHCLLLIQFLMFSLQFTSWNMRITLAMTRQ